MGNERPVIQRRRTDPQANVPNRTRARRSGPPAANQVARERSPVGEGRPRRNVQDQGVREMFRNFEQEINRAVGQLNHKVIKYRDSEYHELIREAYLNNRVSCSTVSRIVNNQTRPRQPGQGGALKTYTQVTADRLCRIMRRNPNMSCHEIQVQYFPYLSYRIVHRILRENGFTRQKVIHKPFIDDVIKRKRLAFARFYSALNLDFWEKLIYVDEVTFEFKPPQNNGFVILPPNHQRSDRYAGSRSRFDSKSYVVLMEFGKKPIFMKAERTNDSRSFCPRRVISSYKMDALSLQSN